MTSLPFQVKLWGTRGSLPVSGPAFRKFGGNTVCIEVRCGPHVLIFDAGSGIVAASRALIAEAHHDIALFFSHFHYDHIMGLPFFEPLYCDKTRMRFFAGDLGGHTPVMQTIGDFMRRPFFPIGPDYWRARIEPVDFRAGDVLTPYPGVKLRTTMLNHPGNAVGYRIEWNGRAAAMVFDTEHQPESLSPEVISLVKGCDLFLYDATFTDEEFDRFRGYGHSTWQQGVRLAQAAGAKRVGFVHHAKWRSDAELATIERLAKGQFDGAFCGRDGQVIAL